MSPASPPASHSGPTGFPSQLCPACALCLFRDKCQQLGSEAAKPGPAAPVLPSLSVTFHLEFWSQSSPFVHSKLLPPFPGSPPFILVLVCGSLPHDPVLFHRGLLGQLCKLSKFLSPSSRFALHRKSSSISVAITEYDRLVDL